MYLGDYRVSDTLYFAFTTRAFSTGAPTQLAGTPAISVYKDADDTQTTTGVTLAVDDDGITGWNRVTIALSDAFYTTATDFQVVITTGTVGGVSVVGETVAHFSIENRSALRPTTAARTLDVTAAGNAGIDWANVENPTTALNLSATNIDVDQVVASVSGAVGSVTGAVGSVTGNVGGNVAGTVASVVGNVGGNVTGSVGSVVGAVGSVTGNVGGNVAGSVGSVTGNVGGNLAGDVQGNVDGSVDSVTQGVTVAVGGIDATSFAAGAIDAAALATDAVTEISNGVATRAYDGAVTLEQSIRLANSANGAKLSGAATTTVAIRDLADSKDRVTATVDADGNRTAVVRDLT